MVRGQRRAAWSSASTAGSRRFCKATIFRSGEELETTLHRYVRLYNQQLPQSALGSKSPLQAMKDWYKLKSQLFRKKPYYLLGCDTYRPDKCRGW